jgi:hypothetical protein
MSTRAQRARTAIALVCCVAFPCSAFAQRRPLELFAGYALLHDTQEDLDLPIGWAAGGARGVNDWLALVADAGGNYKTVRLVGGDARVTTHSLLAGTRASAKIGRLIEFGELLAGAVHTTGTSFGQSNTTTHFAVQAGGGVDIPFGERVAGRLQIDVRFPDVGHQMRYLAGLTWTLR